jgi:hypothetical protein
MEHVAPDDVVVTQKVLLRLDSIDNQLEQLRNELTGLFTSPLLSTDVVSNNNIPNRPSTTMMMDDEDRQFFDGGTPFCACSIGDWISLTLCR